MLQVLELQTAVLEVMDLMELMVTQETLLLQQWLETPEAMELMGLLVK